MDHLSTVPAILGPQCEYIMPFMRLAEIVVVTKIVGGVAGRCCCTQCRKCNSTFGFFFFWPPPFKRWSRFNPPPSSSSSPLELPHSSSMYFFGILLLIRLGAIDLFLVRVRLTFFFRERTKEETRIEPPFRFVVDDCGAAQEAFLGAR